MKKLVRQIVNLFQDGKLVTMQEAERFTHKDNLLIYFIIYNYIFVSLLFVNFICLCLFIIIPIEFSFH